MISLRKGKMSNAYDPSDGCGICYEIEGRVFDSPRESEMDSTCLHYLCTECWQSILDTEDLRCPICRVDITDWITNYYPLSEDESD